MTTAAELADEERRALFRELINPPPLPCSSFWGHRFEARYSLGAAPPMSVKAGGADPADITAYMDTMRTKTYHGDICVRCGQFRALQQEKKDNG